MNQHLTETEVAQILKSELDEHINTDGNKSSILEFNIIKIDFLKNLNLNLLFQECKKLNIQADYTSNSILNKQTKSKDQSSIVISYDKIHK